MTWHIRPTMAICDTLGVHTISFPDFGTLENAKAQCANIHDAHELAAISWAHHFHDNPRYAVGWAALPSNRAMPIAWVIQEDK